MARNVRFYRVLAGDAAGLFNRKVAWEVGTIQDFEKEWIDAATNMFQKNGEAAILIGSFTPVPFKVFTILSGCLNFRYGDFWLMPLWAEPPSFML